jgi:uncharacterized protein with PIN domain
MIVVDASALLAILLGEPEKEAFRRAIRGAERCLISAVNVHEAAIVLRGRTGGAGMKQLWHLLVEGQFEVIAFDRAGVRGIRSLQSLWQGHSLKGASQSLRLRGLCAGQAHERALAVQG